MASRKACRQGRILYKSEVRVDGDRGGGIQLMDQIPDLLPQANDHTLEIAFITKRFNLYQSIHNPKALIDQALEHFQHVNDPSLQCRSSL